MIITQHNNRIADSRNFDSYKNYYAILYNQDKYTFIKDKNRADIYTVYTSHIETKLIISIDTQKEISNSIYNIVYGHFYNDQNFFLFKKVKNGKIIGYKVNKCQRSELWHNKLNQLYISNYFSDVQKTTIMLNDNANEEIATDTTNPALSYIVYNEPNEELIFNTLWNSEYWDELVTITIDNPYIIQNKNLKNIFT